MTMIYKKMVWWFLVICCFMFYGCSHSGRPGTKVLNGSKNSADKLIVIAPNIVPSVPNVRNYGYIVIMNPTESLISNIKYQLTDIQGSGRLLELDNKAVSSCSSVPAHGRCVIKISVNGDVGAGSARLTVSDSYHSIYNSPIIGVSKVEYNHLAGVDGVSLHYHHEVIEGIPYFIITGVVNSDLTGAFNMVQIMDSHNKIISNQEVVSGNLGAGQRNLKQGDTFSILLPVPAGNVGQVIKFSLDQLNENNQLTQQQISSDSTVKVDKNVGIIEAVPNSVQLNAEHPKQVITLVNNGDTPAKLKQVETYNQNVNLTYRPESINSNFTTTIQLELKNLAAPATNGDVIITYDNGKELQREIIKVITDSGISPEPTKPVAGLLGLIGADNLFYTTTVQGDISRQLTIVNSGNTTESNFVVTLPDNFVLAESAANSCKIQVDKTSTKILNSLASGENCNLKLSYHNNALTSESSGLITISYNYNNGVPAETKTQIGVAYRVTQSSANLGLDTLSHDFETILNDNYESKSHSFIITNNGEIATEGKSFKRFINGVNASVFSLSNESVPGANHCTDVLNAGESCLVSVKFGTTNAKPIESIQALFNVSYVDATKVERVVSAALEGAVANAADSVATDISTAVAQGFTIGSGVSNDPYQLAQDQSADLIFTYNNHGKKDAESFYVSENNLPDGWQRKGGTCSAAAPGAALKAAGSCTAIYHLDGRTLGVHNFDRSAMTIHWRDAIHPSGVSRDLSSLVTFVNVFKSGNLNYIDVTSEPSPISDVVMGGGFQIKVTANGSVNTTVSINSNDPLNQIYSTPSPCALSSSNSSCVFNVVSQWDSSATPGTNNSYQLSLTSSSNVQFNNSVINYTRVVPTIVLPTPGDNESTGSGNKWPVPRFVPVSGNPDCMEDKLTGLIWIAKADSNAYSLAEATNKIAQLNTANKCGFNSGWRLPSRNELWSLVNFGRPVQADWLNSSGFNNIESASYYWSSAVNATTHMNWLVGFGSGAIDAASNTNSSTEKYYILPVLQKK